MSERFVEDENGIVASTSEWRGQNHTKEMKQRRKLKLSLKEFKGGPISAETSTRTIIYIQIYIYSMNKQLATQANTKQLKKAKLLESFRQPITSKNNANRIMLTDLCPEEKAKIGELVRTLEARKAEIMAMDDRLKEQERKEKKSMARIQQLEKTIEEMKNKQFKLKEELTLSKIKQQQRERYIEILVSEKQQKENKAKQKAACVDQFSMTNPITVSNQYVQVSQKKRKCKEKKIQTEEVEMEKRYPRNSRSFEKIMRGRSKSQENSSDKQKPSNSHKFKRSEIKIDDNEEEGYDGENVEELEDYDNNKISQMEQEDDEEDFNELAKKWLELKQKNMSKIKESYQKSKERQNSSHLKKKQREGRNTNPSAPAPRQFNDRGAADEEDSNDFIGVMENESFGPKKNQNQGKPSGEKYKISLEGLDEDLDDIQLNRILKSKNFSASRLLKKDRQNSQYGEMGSGVGRGQFDENTGNLKMSTISNSRSRAHIDFYETDLLDIVSSITRK